MHRPWSGQSNINFHMRDIWRNVLPKFIELCLERPCLCPFRWAPTWWQKATETSVTEFCYIKV